MIHILSMKQLESLDAYRTAQDLAAQAYRLTQVTPLTKHFALIDQIRRACLSVPANIAEGYAAPISPRHAKRLGLADAQELDSTIALAVRVIAILIGLL